MDYIDKFNARIEKFTYAVTKYGHCMENEFKTAINELDLKDREILVNLAGGGLNLNKYVITNTKYIPFDFVKEWTNFDKNIIYTCYKKLPLENSSVDKIIILAVLHHFTDQEREELYKECHRVLKKSGKLVIADVIKNSDQDIWLNTFVNKYNPFGHNGQFFTNDDAKLLENNNFNVIIKDYKYCWWFNNGAEMLDYMKSLFYLDISDEKLMDGINSVLKPKLEENKYYIDWQLKYFICEPY